MLSLFYLIEVKEVYKSMMAGYLIALGGYVNLKVGGVLGAFLFSLGLLSVIAFKTPLYTGMVSNLESYNYPRNMCKVLVYNCIGAAGLGLLFYGSSSDSAINVLSKLDKNLFSIMLDSFICGSCVSIAVKSHSKLMTIMAVAVFILSGGEHCVADVFYFMSIGTLPITFILTVIVGNTLGGIVFGNITK